MLFNKEQDITIEQYCIDVFSYKTCTEKLKILEEEREKLETEISSILWFAFFCIFIPIIFISGDTFSKDFSGVILGVIATSYIAWFVSSFFYAFHFIRNIVSLGKLNKLEKEIEKTSEQKESVYQKIVNFESPVCDYYHTRLEEYYINNLLKKRSGNRQFEESLSEFSSMIDEILKINAIFIARHVCLEKYTDYLLKRSIDHHRQASKSSEKSIAIRNFVQKVLELNEQKQKAISPPEKIYRTARKIEDWDEIYKKRRITGSKGEEIAVVMEREFFIKINRKDLADRVNQVSKIDSRLGYDILSFFEDGREKFIEVKSTTATLDSPYYLSQNELEFLKTHGENALIYRFLLSDNIPQLKIYTSHEILEMNILPVQYVVEPR